MNRRQLLCATGVALPPGLGGCLGTSSTNDGVDSTNAVSLTVENGGGEDRTVSTEILDRASEVVFSEEYDVPAGERVSEEAILPAGEYTVHVEVSEVGETTYEFHMSGCNENTIIVEFKRAIHVRTACHAD